MLFLDHFLMHHQNCTRKDLSVSLSSEVYLVHHFRKLMWSYNLVYFTIPLNLPILTYGREIWGSCTRKIRPLVNR